VRATSRGWSSETASGDPPAIARVVLVNPGQTAEVNREHLRRCAESRAGKTSHTAAHRGAPAAPNGCQAKPNRGANFRAACCSDRTAVGPVRTPWRRTERLAVKDWSGRVVVRRNHIADQSSRGGEPHLLQKRRPDIPDRACLVNEGHILQRRPH